MLHKDTSKSAVKATSKYILQQRFPCWAFAWKGFELSTSMISHIELPVASSAFMRRFSNGSSCQKLGCVKVSCEFILTSCMSFAGDPRLYVSTRSAGKDLQFILNTFSFLFSRFRYIFTCHF